MQVLRHAVVTDFNGTLQACLVFECKARFKEIIERYAFVLAKVAHAIQLAAETLNGRIAVIVSLATAEVVETAPTEAIAQGDAFAYLLVVGNEKGVFPTVAIWQTEVERATGLFAGRATGPEYIIRALTAESDCVFRAQVPGKLRFCAVIEDVAVPVKRIVAVTKTQVIIVFAVEIRKVHEELIAENVVPAGAERRVSPDKLDLVTGAENVVAKVSGDIQSVFFTQCKICFSTQVVKIKAAVFQLWLRGKERFSQYIDITASCRYNKRSLVFDDRTFEAETAENGSHATASFHFFFVSVFAAHINYRRKTTAIIGPDSTFYQLHIFHHIRVEYAEEPEQVAAVENRSLIEQDQVLIGASAAHIKTAAAFAD